mgnify:CR=1 FL=1
MKIKRDLTAFGKVVHTVLQLTNEELEEAYREREREYRLQDAETHLLWLVDGEPDTDAEDDFTSVYGFPYTEAIDKGSEHYLLDAIVDEFERSFDCNIAENDTWQHAVETVLNDLRKEVQ